MADNVISLTRGDNLNLHVNVIDKDGNEYTLADNDALTFTVKRNTVSTDALITKTGQDFTIYPTDTNGLDYGTYAYDVQLVKADGTVCTIIKPSEFRVTGEVTW